MAKKKSKTKLLVKIPLDDYLSSGKEIQEGQILYLQDIKYSHFGAEIVLKPYIYLSHNNKGVTCQKKIHYINESNKGIQSYPIGCYFIEIEINI